MSKTDWITQEIENLKSQGLYNNIRTIGSPQGAWLIVDGNKIYLQWNLDWTELENASLNYVFPFARDNRWYPHPEQRKLFSPYRAAWIPGMRIVTQQAERVVLENTRGHCFEIQELYNAGATVEWFCAEIGIVAEHFDHAGTPFGLRSELVQFIKGE